MTAADSEKVSFLVCSLKKLLWSSLRVSDCNLACRLLKGSEINGLLIDYSFKSFVEQKCKIFTGSSFSYVNICSFHGKPLGIDQT